LKANPKIKADPKADAAAGGNPKKTLLLVIVATLLLALIGGGGAAWYFLAGSSSKSEQAKVAPPVYVTLDQFTVNLQPENGEQYLQVQFTLQVPNAEQAELIKANMALVRNRVLLLLSAKHASEINTVDGKRQLASEIVNALKAPFYEKGEPQQVSNVLFTAFIIQ